MARLYVPLDVNFPDDDKIEAVGLVGAGLYASALCVAKRTLTDGKVTRTKLRRLGADDALIDHCIEVGLFAPDAGDALRIPAWLGWNQPSESVLTSEKASQLAHIRHHVNKKRPNPSCRYCVEENPQVNAEECGPASQRNAEHALQKEESESKPESNPRSISEIQSLPEPVATVEPTPPTMTGKALEQAAARSLLRYSTSVAKSTAAIDPGGMAAAIRRDAQTDGRLATLTAWIADGLDPDAAADRLASDGGGPTGPSEAERQAADERAKRALEATKDRLTLMTVVPDSVDHASGAALARQALHSSPRASNRTDTPEPTTNVAEGATA